MESFVCVRELTFLMTTLEYRRPTPLIFVNANMILSFPSTFVLSRRRMCWKAFLSGTTRAMVNGFSRRRSSSGSHTPRQGWDQPYIFCTPRVGHELSSEFPLKIFLFSLAQCSTGLAKSHARSPELMPQPSNQAAALPSPLCESASSPPMA